MALASSRQDLPGAARDRSDGARKPSTTQANDGAVVPYSETALIGSPQNEASIYGSHISLPPFSGLLPPRRQMKALVRSYFVPGMGHEAVDPPRLSERSHGSQLIAVRIFAYKRGISSELSEIHPRPLVHFST